MYLQIINNRFYKKIFKSHKKKYNKIKIVQMNKKKKLKNFNIKFKNSLMK